MKGFLFLLLFCLPAFAQSYPSEWFIEIPREEGADWEILPQDAKPGEVILSKRTELGVFSNFAHTPFELDGKVFASVEGLWQSLKFPDPQYPDERMNVSEWIFTREEVERMVSFEAKRAGDHANQLFRIHGLKNVNWKNHFFDYVDDSHGSAFHYDLIKKALKAKLDQTSGLWELLLKTGCLNLKPDHEVSERAPSSFFYFKIFMELRREKLKVPCQDHSTSK